MKQERLVIVDNCRSWVTDIWWLVAVDSIFVCMLEIFHNKKLRRERAVYSDTEDFQDIVSILVKSKLQNDVFNRTLFLLKYAKRNICRVPVMARL